MADSKPVLVLLRGDDQLERSQADRRAGHDAASSRRSRGNLRRARRASRQPGRGGSQWAEQFMPTSVLREAAGHDHRRERGWFSFAPRRHRARHPGDALGRLAHGPGRRDLCRHCGKPLKIRRAIEVGHVFKLGTKYSEKLNALFLDEQGKQQSVRHGLLRHRGHAHVAGRDRAVPTTRTASCGRSPSRLTWFASRR